MEGGKRICKKGGEERREEGRKEDGIRMTILLGMVFYIG